MIQTAQRLDKERFESQVLSLRPRGPLSALVEQAGLRLTHLEMALHPGPGTLWRLVTWLRDEHIDIIHAYLYHASVLSRVAGRVAGVPVVITSTRCSLDYLPRYAWWVDRWTAPLGDRILAVSNGTADFIVNEEHIDRSRVVVVPNGVDLDRFRPGDQMAARRALRVDSGDYVIAVIGRLHEQKGHRYLVEALAALRPEIPGLRCLVAGDGPLRSTLERQVRDLGLGDVLRFLGRVDDPRPVYDAADLVVLPSLYEGMPNVVLEAMAMGVPVVATAVAGSVELVEDSVTGFLVPRADSASLARAIGEARRRWSGDAGVRVTLRKRAEASHGLDTMVRQVASVYEEHWQKSRA